MYRLFAIFCMFILASSQLNVKECTKPGWMCETCTTSVMCVEIDGKFTKTDRINCPAQNSCYLGSCTTELNPLCDYELLPFPCNYQGLYPHPGDWTKYIFCEPVGSDPKGPYFTAHTLNCEPGTGYDGQWFYCNRDLMKIAESDFPIERCLEQSNEPIALPGNPSIYYICSLYEPYMNNKLYPHQYTCPSGGRFLDGECKPNME